MRSVLAVMASMALMIACTPPPPAPGEGVAPNAAACQKTGQQCRLGQGGALGVCMAKPDTGQFTCTPQH